MKKDLREVYRLGMGALSLQFGAESQAAAGAGEMQSAVHVTPNHSYWIMPDGSVEDVHGDLGANAEGSKYSHGIFAANWAKLRQQHPQRYPEGERAAAERIERRARELERIIAVEARMTDTACPFTEVDGRWYDEEGRPVTEETVRTFRPRPPNLEGFDAHPGELAYKHAAQEEGWLRVRPQTMGLEQIIYVEGIDPNKMAPAQRAIIDRDVVQAGYRLVLLSGGAMANRQGFKLGELGSGE